MNDILTEKEVAELLDCEPATVQEKARNADLPGLKFGRAWVFPRSALMESLHTQALARKADRPRAKAIVPQPLTDKERARKAPPVLPVLTMLHQVGGG